MRTIEAWFDALYLEHAPKMRKLAARTLDDAAIAEDLVHNVFILLLAHQEEVRQYENPVGWMYITLRNQIGNELQRAERRRVISLETADLRAVQYEDRQNTLLEILPGELRQEEREMLVMFYEHRMSHTEIAAALGCTELACRCRLHRIKKRCYDLLLSREAKKTKTACNISAMQANVYSKEAWEMSMFHSENSPEQIQRHTAKRQKEVECLTDQLADWLANVSENQVDEQVLDDLLGALDDLDPLPDEADTDAELEHFHQDYESLFVKMQAEADAGNSAKEEKKKKRPAGCRKAVRKLILVAAVLAALLCGMITAQAFGVDVFGALGRWTNEVFHFGKVAQVEAVVQRYPMALDEEVEYASLQEAVAAFGIDAPLVPQWIPERFSEESHISATVSPQGALIRAAYLCEEGTLTISIKEIESGAAETIVEKDGQQPSSYYKGGQYHYILFDKEYTKIVWRNGNLECNICGLITESEATSIIDSIY